MDKYDVEYRMYSLKSICEIFDELLSYDTGDDFWKRCVCEASIHAVSYTHLTLPTNREV